MHHVSKFFIYIDYLFSIQPADVILIDDLSSIVVLDLFYFQPFWQPHNRAVARRIQNMGWRADGGLWLLVRGGGLFLSKGTGVSNSENFILVYQYETSRLPFHISPYHSG